MTILRDLGASVARDVLGGLAPDQVLFEMDRPLLFTSRAPAGGLVLVYFVNEELEGDVRLVVPTQTSVIRDLCSGELTLRDALRQPWAWLSFPDEVRVISVEDLPADCLPRSGTYLAAEHAPLLSVRYTGDIDEHNVTASVIGRATDAVRGSLKALLDYLTNAETDGRPQKSHRRLYDLPARRLAYGSLEVDFGAPSQLALLDEERALLGRASELLHKGIAWATNPHELAPPRDDDEWAAILVALRYLVPPATGAVENVEIDGKLTGRRVQLNRRATRNVIRALKVHRGELKPVTKLGWVRELDKDKLTFLLRDAPNVDATESKCFFGEDLSGDVEWAFDAEIKVAVVGFEDARGTRIDVSAVEQSTDEVEPATG